MIILSVSHSFGDGGYLKYIADNILDDTNISIPSYFPYEIQDIFKERYDKAPNNVQFWINNPNVNRVKTNDQSKLHPATEICYSTARIPSKNLQCYDQKTNKIHAFTDSLWTSFFISSVVHNNKKSSFDIPKYICIPTSVDFRRYLAHQNYSICSMFSAVTPQAKVTPKMSLCELGKAMKTDLRNRMDNGEDFGILKATGSLDNPNKNVYLQSSYIGPINVEHPVKDVFISSSISASAIEAVLCLMGFSCVSKSKERNDVVLRLRYSPTTLHKDEVDQMMKNIEYVLTKVPKETSIEETVKAVSSL